MIIKYGYKDFKRNLGFNIFIILLISLTFIACIFASSSVYQKLKYYRVFSDILGGDGYYAQIAISDTGRIRHSMMPYDADDWRCLSDYSEYFGEISAVYSILDMPDENRLTDYVKLYAYRGRLIYDYEPMMSEGKWLADADQNDGYIHAVISPNDLGIKTGDVITQTLDNGEVQVKIVGVFRDGAKFMGIKTSNPDRNPDSEAPVGDKFDETHKIEELFHNYYQSIIIDPILIFNFDELEQIGVAPIISSYLIIPFKEGLTDEQKHQAYMDMIEFTGENVPFSEIRSASLAEVRKQLLILLPVIIGLLVLTMISVLSLTAISTHKQLKNYGVLYLCGGRWRQCAFINTITILIDLVFSTLATCIAMKWLAIAGALKTTVVRFGMTELLICVSVAVFVLVVSLIMPFAIIGKTQPKEILKED